jgi:four helix bundle protein
MNEAEMKQRTKEFALRCLKLCAALPKTIEADVLRRQLARSATSVASSYRAACRAKSTADFVYKLQILEEEADESGLWLELIVEHGMLSAEMTQSLMSEASELTAIAVSSQRTTRKGSAEANPKSAIESRKFS